ncbi:MAG: DUF268 domain-containing protein [Planctomycetota bacterium]
MSSVFSRWKRPLKKGKLLRALLEYPRYIRDLRKYTKMVDAEPIKFSDTYPCLYDRTAKTSVDSHYFYQHLWAFKKIYALKPKLHVDVGSNVDFVGLLSAITKVNFIDIRPLDVSDIENLESIKGNILDLSYDDDSLESVSCLHVAEHIGLGRYGDPLDPLGTKKAAAELSRCLTKGGNLFFSLPVGKPRVCFNAHRIHSPKQILQYFSDLKLIEFTCTDDNKRFMQNINIDVLENAKYGCGMFCFTKE